MGEVTTENPHVTATRDGSSSVLVSMTPGGGSPRRRLIASSKKKASLFDTSEEDSASSSDAGSTSSSGTSESDSTSDSSAYTSESDNDDSGYDDNKNNINNKAGGHTGKKRSSFRTPHTMSELSKPPPMKRVRYRLPTDDQEDNDSSEISDADNTSDANTNPWASENNTETNPIQDVRAGRPCVIVFGRRYFTGWSDARFVFSGMVDAMTGEDVTLSHKDDVVTVDLATGIVDSSNIEALEEDDDDVPWRVREVSSDGKVGK